MPIRPSSPTDMMSALLGIDKQYQSADMFDNIYKMASTMEKFDTISRNKIKYGTPGKPGTPGTPAVTRPVLGPSRPAMRPELGLRGGTAFTDPVVNMLTEEVSPAIPGKPAIPGTLGTEQLETRRALLPYVATVDKPGDRADADVRLLLTEPDLNTALGGVRFGPKKPTTSITISKDIASAFKSAGFDVEVGELMSGDDYRRLLAAARLKFSVERENRLQSTVGEDLELKRERLKQSKAKTAKTQAEAAITAEINRIMGGGNTGLGTTSSGNRFELVK